MSAMSRRAALGLFRGFTLTIAAGGAALAADTDGDARAVVAEFQAALIGVMKAGRATPFAQRCTALAPVLDRTFDMPAVLKLVVGPRWISLTASGQAQLQQAFLRYSVASWVANFDSYSGQAFRFLPAGRKVGSDGWVVGTELVAVSGEAHRLDFVLRKTAAGWRVMDVLADGTISRIAVLRSDFQALMADGTGAALSAALDKKVTDLSAGVTA